MLCENFQVALLCVRHQEFLFERADPCSLKQKLVKEEELPHVTRFTPYIPYISGKVKPLCVT